MHDSCQWDTSERIFYIYRIGRFHNKTHYYYGDTSDLYATDLHITARLPFKERVIVVPREEYQKEIQRFIRDIEPHKNRLCIQAETETTCFDCFVEPHDKVLTTFLELLHAKHIE